MLVARLSSEVGEMNTATEEENNKQTEKHLTCVKYVSLMLIHNLISKKKKEKVKGTFDLV